MHRLDEHRELEPKSLASAGRRFPNWGAFSVSPEGDELRQAKALAQKGLCGYCECALWHDGVLPKGGSHLDHFIPRRTEEEKKLLFSWDNLILSCERKRTCGRRKDDKGVNRAKILNPLRDDVETYITFVLNSAWEICAVPRPGLSEEDKERAQYNIDVVYNLNDPGLKSDRMNRFCALCARMEECASSAEAGAEEDDMYRQLLDDILAGEFPTSMMDLARERVEMGLPFAAEGGFDR